MGDVEWQAGQFPSPTGSSYFSIELSLLIESLENLVSVPYGVFVFLNDVLAFLGCLRVAFVSVPYGVFVFLNLFNSFFNIKYMFPSPTGSSYFSMASNTALLSSLTVSVPYGVFVFLNVILAVAVNRCLLCFRPLRGLRISQLCPPIPSS